MASKKRHTVDSWVESTISEVINGKGCSLISLLHLKGIGGASEEVMSKLLILMTLLKILLDEQKDSVKIYRVSTHLSLLRSMEVMKLTIRFILQHLTEVSCHVLRL
jgi:hypothetical protein